MMLMNWKKQLNYVLNLQNGHNSLTNRYPNEEFFYLYFVQKYFNFLLNFVYNILLKLKNYPYEN
jgi:hypothetical protein